MAGKRPLEVITPPNMLRVKVGGRVGAGDPGAVSRAEGAMHVLSGEFAHWLESEISELEAARRRVMQEGLAGDARDELHRRAHDLKGLGATYGYPIVSRLAGLLSRLLEARPEPGPAVLALIEADVNAIRAAVRDGVKTEGHPVGKALATELAAQTAKFLPG